MGIKVFATTRSGAQLVGDERDIMISNQLIADVIEWCEQTGIKAEQVPTSPMIQWSFGVNLWRIHDEQQRVLFALRWA